MHNLYLPNGYLNQRWINSTADQLGISFIIEIGGRQVGKTFGTLQLMLDLDKKFILMRRTKTELKYVCKDIINPFRPIPGYNVKIKDADEYSASIYKEYANADPELIGMVLSLSTVSKVRGFNGQEFTDLIYDEFIPESHVVKIKNEGEAFLNAHVTINGAREENGLPPLKTWLLANPNTINSPILSALNLSNKIEEMTYKGQELSILPERGVIIVMPKSPEIMEKRKKSSLYKLIGNNSNFAKMSLGNEFSYNDMSDIGHVHLKEYKLYLQIGAVNIYKHKSRDVLYVTDFLSGQCNYSFEGTDSDRLYVRRNFPYLREYYIQRRIIFSDMNIKQKFIDLFV